MFEKKLMCVGYSGLGAAAVSCDHLVEASYAVSQSGARECA